MVYLSGLNAPYGAWCFLTVSSSSMRRLSGLCLNAPYGARYFLTATGLKWGREKAKAS